MTITVNECAWVRPIELSDTVVDFIEQNIGEPEVREDANEVVSHNEAYDRFCGA